MSDLFTAWAEAMEARDSAYASGYERATNAALYAISKAFKVAPDHPVMMELRASRDKQWTQAGLPVPGPIPEDELPS